MSFFAQRPQPHRCSSCIHPCGSRWHQLVQHLKKFNSPAPCYLKVVTACRELGQGTVSALAQAKVATKAWSSLASAPGYPLSPPAAFPWQPIQSAGVRGVTSRVSRGHTRRCKPRSRRTKCRYAFALPYIIFCSPASRTQHSWELHARGEASTTLARKSRNLGCKTSADHTCNSCIFHTTRITVSAKT